MLREHRECIKRAAAWFHAKWGVPQEAYEESMLACLEKNTAIPQWYLAVHRAEIIGGVGVIENDFHDRKDLSPNLCALFVEEAWRNQGIAGKLLQFICDDMEEWKSIPALRDRASGSYTGTSAEWTALCRRESTYRISQSRPQILKKSSDCWHKTQQADSFRCPPVCLTIHKVQKMYLWELSDRKSFLFGARGGT